MKCNLCGSVVPDTSKFCPECGAKMEIAREKRTIQLRCKACGGIMNVDEDKPILSCQFCNSKELIDESDDVTIQRIKSKTYKEIELEKLKQEERKEKLRLEKERKQAAENELKKFKKSKLSKFLLIFFVIGLLTTISAFSHKNILPGLIAGVQTISFALAWLLGMQFIPKKHPNIHVLFATVGFVLYILFFNVNGRSDLKQQETYVWPTGGINTVLPQPKSNKGYIIDSKDSFFITVYNTSEKDFQSYIEACIEQGFTIDSQRDSTSYDAYNDAGYDLGISYFKSGKDMQIDLDASKVFGKIEWPKSNIAKLLPVPKSNMGKIEWEAEDGFVIYIGDTSIDDFNEYVEECITKGFTDGYKRGEDYYYADNADGYCISLKYQGFNTMFIRIDEPDDKSEKSDITETTEQEMKQKSGGTSETEKETSYDAADIKYEHGDASGEMRLEFKETVDKYEEFFGEYCVFMKKYDEAENPAALLSEYTVFLTQYAETMEKMSALGEGEMNEAETAYYTEAMMRITQKLLNVG